MLFNSLVFLCLLGLAEAFTFWSFGWGRNLILLKPQLFPQYLFAFGFIAACYQGGFRGIAQAPGRTEARKALVREPGNPSIQSELSAWGYSLAASLFGLGLRDTERRQSHSEGCNFDARSCQLHAAPSCALPCLFACLLGKNIAAVLTPLLVKILSCLPT